MAWPIYVVDSKVKLRDLRDHTKPRFVRRYQGIEFALPDLSDQENARLTSELNRKYKTCGCAEGAVLGTVALAAYIVTQVIGGDAQFQWTQIPVGVGVFFVGTTVGKFLGVYRGYLAFRGRLTTVLEQEGLPVEKPEEPKCAVN